MLLNTKQHYGRISQVLHWVIALLIIFLISIGFLLPSLPRQHRFLWMTLHKSFGLTVLFLMLVRLGLQLMQVKPSLDKLRRWERTSAYLSHGLLYALAIVMPLSGWMMSSAFGYPTHWLPGIKLTLSFIEGHHALGFAARQTHQVLAWVLGGLIIVHSLAALKHQFIDKIPILKRMIQGPRDP